MQRYFLIEKAILTILHRQEEANWQEIMMEVSEALIIDNWMEVRDVIQNLKNQGKVRRIDDVYRERYTIC